MKSRPLIETKLPPPLRWAIDRCLAKEPTQRYESTRDLYHDLRALRDHLSEAYTSVSIEPVKTTARLCCKNHSVGETEPAANLVGRLFSFQSEDFPDELNLPKDIPFRQPPHLAFPNHVQNLVALNRPPGSIG